MVRAGESTEPVGLRIKKNKDWVGGGTRWGREEP